MAWHGNLHPHSNSSNLATRVSEQPGQFRGKLAQLGSYCAIVCGKRQDLPVKLEYMAGTHECERGYLHIMPLQRKNLLRLTGQLIQFPTGTEVTV